MRITSEEILHLSHEREVPHPSTETLEPALNDFERLDMIGAATLFLDLAHGSNQHRVDPEAVVPDWMRGIPSKDRLSFITEIREDMAKSLVRAEIIPSRLVTSAIYRLSLQLNGDRYLTQLAERRLASDPVFYPVRVPSDKTLLDKAKRMIALEFIHGQNVTPELMQTEDEALSLARKAAA
jgi:hypothetical protein